LAEVFEVSAKVVLEEEAVVAEDDDDAEEEADSSAKVDAWCQEAEWDERLALEEEEADRSVKWKSSSFSSFGKMMSVV
jgi:hypothetical protein